MSDANTETPPEGQQAPEQGAEVETEEVEAPYESEGARRIRIREANKTEAAVTMKEEAERAKRRKARRLGKAPEIEGQAEFRKRAAEIEAELNKEDS